MEPGHVSAWNFLLPAGRRFPQLLENRVHHSRCQQYLRVWDRRGCAVDDRAVKGPDQFLLSRLHMEVVGQEQPHVTPCIRQVLPREDDRWKEPLDVTLERYTPQLDHGLLLFVEKQAILRTKDPKLLQKRPHPRRERETC